MAGQKPLDGVVVLDFTRVYAGPYCAMLLADFGADVIKVERKDLGDDSRQFLPLVEGRNESGYFLYYNRNKKSIELDLKDARARELVYRICPQVDVVIENFAPGVAAKLGIDYDTLKQHNPKIIYGSISGFGQTGPYRNKAAYDIIAQAMGGYMAITGEEGATPLKLGTSIADAGTGVQMAFAIASAMYYREKTGVGQYIDISMQDVVFSTLENSVMMHTYGGAHPTREGNHNKGAAPFNSYPTKNGKYVCIAVANEDMFARCMTAMGMPEYITDPRFMGNQKRKEHEAALDEIVGSWTGQRDIGDICKILDDNKVPVGPILEIDELVQDPHLLEREMVVEMEHTREGTVKMPGSPFKFSETKIDTFRSSPLLGEHTWEILRQFAGLDDGAIQELYDTGVIFQKE